MMYPFILLAVLSLTASVISVLSRRHVYTTEDCEASSFQSDKKNATTSGQQRVPGNSPAEYVGDRSNDVLLIETLDLCPNPPEDKFVLNLQGDITEDIGKDPQLHLLVYLNGRRGPTLTNTLCPGPTKMKIVQHGKPLGKDEVPKKGRVEMSYENLIPAEWLRKGWYTVKEGYGSKAAWATVAVDGNDTAAGVFDLEGQ